MKIKDYFALLMAKLSNKALPWIFLIIVLLLRLNSVFIMVLWPPSTMTDYALRVRLCQHERTRHSLDAEDTRSLSLWNRLTSIVNVCAYNPELAIGEYRSESGLRLFHIMNRNMLITDDECTVVSVNNAMHADAEEGLAAASKCKFYASDRSINGRSSYHTETAPWEVILDPLRNKKPNNESADPKVYSYWKGGALTTDFRSLLILKFGVQNVDNLIVGPFDHNKEFSHLLWPSFYKTYATRFCQVNIIYQHMGLVSLKFFTKSFHDILYAGSLSSFFIVRTSKSADNKYMNLFAINFMENYCVERYFKPTLEFETKI